MNFQTIKEKILAAAKEKEACKEQYARALRAKNLQELAQVIKENFGWCSESQMLTVDFIKEYEEDFASVEIYANKSISSGYVLIDGVVEELRGSAIAYMYGKATVNKMRDNALVKEMHGNSTVNAMHQNASVNKMYGNALVKEMYGKASVKEMYGNATVNKMHDNALVKEMCDNAYISTYKHIDCEINDNAIMRVKSENKIYHAGNVEFVKI